MARDIARVEEHHGPGIDTQAVSARFMLIGNQMKNQVTDLLHEGNAHQMIIRECDGPVLLAVPLTFGLAGAVLFVLFARFRWTLLVTLISLFFRIQIVVEPSLQPIIEGKVSELTTTPKRQRRRA